MNLLQNLTGLVTMISKNSKAAFRNQGHKYAKETAVLPKFSPRFWALASLNHSTVSYRQLHSADTIIDQASAGFILLAHERYCSIYTIAILGKCF